MEKIEIEREDRKPTLWEKNGKTAIRICDVDGVLKTPLYGRITENGEREYQFSIKIGDIVIISHYDEASYYKKTAVYQITDFFEKNGKEYARLKKLAYYFKGKFYNKKIMEKYKNHIMSAIEAVHG